MANALAKRAADLYNKDERSLFPFFTRQLLRDPNERYLMIVRCHHLCEAGIMTHDCCSHCHIHAGCCLFDLPNGHEAHLCCAHADSFTPEEVAVIVTWIPTWEKQETCISAPAAPEIPLAFRPAYQAIQRLEGDERYLVALILGAVAQGDATEYSEMEVWVIVSEGRVSKRRPHQSHMIFEGTRLSLVFLSWDQFYDGVYRDIKRRDRIKPVFIAGSLIIFDKIGKLRRMQEGARYLLPSTLSPYEKQELHTKLCNWQTLVQRVREDDPLAGSHLMYESLLALLVGYYRLQRRWWVGNRGVLVDLRHWDYELARLVEQFLAAKSADEKFRYWWAISFLCFSHHLQVSLFI